ncbi:hypothetical protein I4U23_025148 [Adineta vaga]|nr:hypothetical protein I4U23_025148 [Adineta vaga]
MSTLVVNRAQSANARVVRHTSTKNQPSSLKQRPTTSGGVRRSSTLNQPSYIPKRPTTSVGTVRSHTDVYHSENIAPFEVSVPLETTRSAQRRKTLQRSTITNTSSPTKKLDFHEIRELLISIARDEPYICKINCLNLYRKLVETMDLRATPLDWKLLYELQRLENDIIQKNACGEVRFKSLIDVLVPQYVSGADDLDPKKSDSRKMSVHRSANDHMEY